MGIPLTDLSNEYHPNGPKAFLFSMLPLP